MRQLVIGRQQLALHRCLYSRSILDMLEMLAGGEPVRKLGKTELGKVGQATDWLKAQSDAEQGFYEFVARKHRELDFLTLDLRTLVGLCQDFDIEYEKLLDGERKNVKTALKEIFAYEQFGRGKSPTYVRALRCWKWVDCSHTWGAWHFLRHLDVRTCCYCNAETVFSLLLDQPRPGNGGGDARKNLARFKRSAFDHYICHSTYPAFGLSLYNLVPACTRCNTNVRGSQELDYFQNIRPYEESFDNFFRFRYVLVSNGVFSPEIQDSAVKLEVVRNTHSQYRVCARGMNTAYFFHLKEVYNQLYLREAVDVIRRRAMIPDERRRDLERHYPLIDKTVLERVLWGVDLKRENINQYRLGKMTLDLMEEMGVDVNDPLR